MSLNELITMMLSLIIIEETYIQQWGQQSISISYHVCEEVLISSCPLYHTNLINMLRLVMLSNNFAESQCWVNYLVPEQCAELRWKWNPEEFLSRRI